MPCAKLILAVAAVMLAAQIQCVAACEIDLCKAQSVPPCHQHHDQTPDSCSFHAVIAQATPDIQIFSVVGMTATTPVVVQVDEQAWPLDLLDPSPPCVSAVSSTILRI